MLFESISVREWREVEEKVSEMVLIGRNLNREWFQNGFEKCVSR
jgi:G3E family GTPase